MDRPFTMSQANISPLELEELCYALELRLNELDERLETFRASDPSNEYALSDTQKKIDVCVKLMDGFHEMKEQKSEKPLEAHRPKMHAGGSLGSRIQNAESRTVAHPHEETLQKDMQR